MIQIAFLIFVIDGCDWSTGAAKVRIDREGKNLKNREAVGSSEHSFDWD
ncbi:hypothetical protein KUV22_11320 [Microbulbifer agarilyticus]|nr:hypothetical protein [Microbulbifer agarilyticus]MBY6191011.1 hypothetical protein [Microbulbifer agarilyticus]